MSLTLMPMMPTCFACLSARLKLEVVVLYLCTALHCK